MTLDTISLQWLGSYNGKCWKYQERGWFFSSYGQSGYTNLFAIWIQYPFLADTFFYFFFNIVIQIVGS